MITDTFALLVDAYREMNSKRLFWITLALSTLVVAAFACFGVNERGLTIIGMTIPIPVINSRIMPPEVFYKIGFIKFGIEFWLTWAATILALVSTAPIFPDFLAGGAIELVLSKPIGRARLFLTKYVSGLIFVTLQVAVFTFASFLVIGIRGHVWEPKVFLAIPIVLCFFSYLFSICALFGLLTRSTIASLLLTLLCWFLIFLISAADRITLTFREATAMQVERGPKRLKRMEAAAATEIAARTSEEPRDYTPEELDAANPFLARARQELAETEIMHHRLVIANDALVWVRTFLPKTDETIWVLKRALITDEEKKRFRVEMANAPQPPSRRKKDDDRPSEMEVGSRVEDILDARSLTWVLGTSLGFEAVVLGFAVWRFRRRDF